MKRLTFIGDIMCEQPLLNASRRGAGYDFTQVFAGCKRLFAEADHVVGNLETVFAGASAGYTKELFSFNTPDEFAEAMAESGIDIVTTATNHSLDRDRAGLFRTLDVLDRLKIEHTGAARCEAEREKLLVKQLGNKRIALLNYTYGTNVHESPFILNSDEKYMLNLLMPQKKPSNTAKKSLLRRMLPIKRVLKLKKLLGREYANKYTDKLDTNNLNEEYLDRFRQDMHRAKAESDIVIVCLHSGGQFNQAPGDQARYFSEFFAKLGADFVINNHPHVVQSTERIDSTLVAYCLGNFSISPSSVYIPHELKPEYSIALHLMFDDDGQACTRFTILKIIEDKRRRIRVLPVDEIAAEIGQDVEELTRDVRFIYSRFTGRDADGLSIEREYAL